ncbi:uncharacterized protein TRIADDRAFT_60094 [Trichoplax adhaerens]|uniref:Death domain-containing protein n=1 Tax=Trichoplax adhaerens TaxID=10228 RepID=B3S7A3_TRIAD|nr:predicted protein [Trichoplax adhaerens]EDV21453.1 predicted protein [Trichoplax adhaerens]|eukprot:XP_002116053.1 predicted protein [Trichoplax adhaerens]
MQTQWAIDPLQDDSKRNQCFIIIADNMDGKRLKEFGLKLGLSSIDVEDIVDNSDERFAKCMNLLRTWYSKFAPKVNWNNLLEASHTCKLANIGEKLGTRHRTWGILDIVQYYLRRSNATNVHVD